MRIITFILLCLFLNIPCFGQDYFEWISPKPTGEILRHSEDKLKIKVRVKPSHPTDAKFDIRVNTNSLYENTRDADVVPIGGYIEREIRVPENSIQSVVVTMEVGDETYISKPLKVARGKLPLPRLFILSLGPTPPDIKYTGKDADDFVQAFSRQHCGLSKLYKSSEIKKLTGKYAEAKDIIRNLKQMAKGKDMTPNDVFILFIASHGYIKDGMLYIQGDDYDPLAEAETTVRMDKIYKILKPLIAKKFIFIDACKSGEIDDDMEKADEIPFYHKRKGYTVITSSKANEVSYHHDEWKNGAFTEILIKALSGEANKKNEKGEIDDIITPNELFDYLKEHVPELVKSKKPYAMQHPTMPVNEYGDYPLFRYDKFCAPTVIGGKDIFYRTVDIPQGEIEIGSIPGEKGRGKDEYLRVVNIDAQTAMGKYEVTNEQYCEFLNDETTDQSILSNWIEIKSKYCKIKEKKRRKRRRKGKKEDRFIPEAGYEDMPIVMISWYGAKKFAEWLSTKDCIYDYDLPTEEQWEAAARGGPYRTYSGTDDFGSFNQREKLMPVGTYMPNALGIHDMSTNVSEWCKNLYEPEETKGAREVRGGNFTLNARQSRTAKRYQFYENTKRKDLGFRLIRTVKKDKDCD